MFVQQEYLYYRKLPIAGDLIGEGITLKILEIFIKKLDVVVAE